MPSPAPPQRTPCKHEIDLVKVFFNGTGDWSAACVGCLARWRSSDDDVPESVLTACDAMRRLVGASKPLADATVAPPRVGQRYAGPGECPDAAVHWAFAEPGTVDCAVFVRGVDRAVGTGRGGVDIVRDAFEQDACEVALTSGDNALILSLSLGRLTKRPAAAARYALTDEAAWAALGAGRTAELSHAQRHESVLNATGGRWWDGSWEAARQHPRIPVRLRAPAGGALDLRMTLVESATGIAVAVRAATLSPRFHRALHEAVSIQMGSVDDPAAPAAGTRQLAEWMARYPTPDVLVRQRAELTCLVRERRRDRG